MTSACFRVRARWRTKQLLHRCTIRTFTGLFLHIKITHFCKNTKIGTKMHLLQVFLARNVNWLIKISIMQVLERFYCKNALNLLSMYKTYSSFRGRRLVTSSVSIIAKCSSKLSSTVFYTQFCGKGCKNMSDGKMIHIKHCAYLTAGIKMLLHLSSNMMSLKCCSGLEQNIQESFLRLKYEIAKNTQKKNACVKVTGTKGR